MPTSDHCIPLDGLGPVRAAPLTDAALTPDRALRTAGVGPGDAVAVVGIGGLGEFGGQLARIRGCHVVAVDKDPGTLDRAREFGADATVEATGSVPRDIMAAADGPVDAVVDFVGVDETLQWASNVLGPDGHPVLAGIGGGTLDLSWNLLVGSEVTCRAVRWGTPTELRDVLELARTDRIETDVQPVALEELPRTFERLEAGGIDGRAIVVP